MTTRDYLFTQYIEQQFGTNYLSSIKYFSIILAFLFIAVILLTNMSQAYVIVKDTKSNNANSSYEITIS